MSTINRDLTSPSAIIVKGVLFVAAGFLATAIVVVDVLSAAAGSRTLLMHGLAVWCFARAYYFAFYVIERYIDPGYRFAGLFSAARWVVRRARGRA